MNKISLIVLVLCSIVAKTLANVKDDRNLVFTSEGEAQLEPARTLQVLRRLSDAHDNEDCKECTEKKREFDELIALSEVTEEKCTQKHVDRMNKLIKIHAESKLNLIPYLQHFKHHLIDECRDQFGVANLVEDSAHDGEDNDNESDVNGEKEGERQSRYDKENAESKDKQSKINEDWLARYNALFFDGIDAKEPKEIRGVLLKLRADRSAVFGLPDGANINRRLQKLVDLRFVSSKSCSRSEFKVFDPLIAEYKQGYNPAILKYVEYHRKALWQACKATFYKNIPSNPSDILTLADHVLAAFGREADESNAPQQGLAMYLLEKLGKKGGIKDNVDSFFYYIIQPMCKSLKFNFIGAQELYQIIADYEDLRNDFDHTEFKWLAALKVCKMITNNPGILNQAQTIVSNELRKKGYFRK